MEFIKLCKPDSNFLSVIYLLRITFLLCISFVVAFYLVSDITNLRNAVHFNPLKSYVSRSRTSQQNRGEFQARDYLDQSNGIISQARFSDDWTQNSETAKLITHYRHDEEDLDFSLTLPRSSRLWSRLPIKAAPKKRQRSTNFKSLTESWTPTPSHDRSLFRNPTTRRNLTQFGNTSLSQNSTSVENLTRSSTSKKRFLSKKYIPSQIPGLSTPSQLSQQKHSLDPSKSGQTHVEDTRKQQPDNQWRTSPFLKFSENPESDGERTPELNLDLEAKDEKYSDQVNDEGQEEAVVRTFATVFPCDKGERNCYHQTNYPVDQCRYKCKQTFNLTEADVVVIYVFKITSDDIMPDFKRPSGQRWVMFDTEPPCRKRNHSMLDLPKLKGQFNWTLSYRLDADIPWLYGYLRELKSPTLKDYNAIFRHKNVTAAWFVGHCSTGSQRDVFVQYMQDYGGLDVHIYGACGNYTCQGECKDKSSNCNKARLKRGSDDKKCLPLLSKKYFFYLAFENSLCKDYVTEKFFKIFKDVDTIPVIRGGADHKKLFPPNTFVDSADFASPAELAVYLKELSKDELRYTRMLREKDKYRFEPSGKWFCKLCEKMHGEGMNRVQRYPDMRAWYVDGQCGLPNDLIASFANTSLHK